MGTEHSDVAYALHDLVLLYSQQRKEDEAGWLFQRTLRICEQSLGTKHLGVATTLYDFAEFQDKQENTRQAAYLYQRALTVDERALGVYGK